MVDKGFSCVCQCAQCAVSSKKRSSAGTRIRVYSPMPVLRRLTWGAQGRQLAVSSASHPSVGCRCGWGGWRHAAEDYIQSCGSTLEVAARTVHSARARFLKPVCMEGRCVRRARKSLRLVSFVCCAFVGSFISGVGLLTSGAVAKACPALRLVLSLCATLSDLVLGVFSLALL